MNPPIKFELNKPVDVYFLYNNSHSSGKSKKGGAWHLYNVKVNDSERALFATDALHALLQQNEPLEKKTLTINKEKGDNYAYFTVNGKSIDDYKKTPVKAVNFGSNGNMVDVLTSIIELCKGALSKLEKKSSEPSSERTGQGGVENPFDKYTPDWAKEESEPDDDIPF